MTNTTQVNRDHYSFDKYAHLDRFASYYYQLREVLRLNPKSVLEIGVGDNMFGSYIRATTDIVYKNLDTAVDLSPDIIASVTDITLGDRSVDVVCAFEVLEHLPFVSFEIALAEMCRVAKEYVVISLPHFGPSVRLSSKIPLLSEIKLSFKIPWPQKHVFNGEHYWEIGKRGFSPRLIRKLISKNGKIVKEFVPFENQYHHFYVLKVKH